MVRSAGNRSHLEQILTVLESAVPGKRTAAGPIFHELAQRLSRRGVVVILSDFFDDLPSIAAGLKHFRHRTHDVILLHVLDPAELDFPFHGPTHFKGLEQFAAIQAEPQLIRQAYLREVDAFRDALESECRRQRVDYFLLRTDQPLDGALRAILATRQRSVR